VGSAVDAPERELVGGDGIGEPVDRPPARRVSTRIGRPTPKLRVIVTSFVESSAFMRSAPEPRRRPPCIEAVLNFI
jgi:hypothetical protein